MPAPLPPKPRSPLPPLRRSTYAVTPTPPPTPMAPPQGIAHLLLGRLFKRLGRPVAGRSMVSLIPLLTMLVFILLALHLVRLALNVAETPSPARRAVVVRPLTEGVPPAMPEVHSSVPVAPHNLQFGDAASPATVVLFTDPACLPCRDRVDAWLRPVTEAGLPVRLVIKYWPQDTGDLTAGQMVELARRHGVGEAYWRALSTLPPATAGATRLTAAQLFEGIEKQGQSLLSLRVKLADDADSLTRTIAQDVDLGQRLRLPPPPVLTLNGYVLDGQPLQPERLATYIRRITSGEPLTSSADTYFAP